MDYYGDKQPPRVYPFFKSQGTRSAPITGQTVERQMNHSNTFIVAANSGNIFDTVSDANSNNGTFDVGKMVGGSSGDDFVIDWEQVYIGVAESPFVFPVTLSITSIAAYLRNTNTGSILWQSAPYSGVISGNPEVTADFAPLMKPLRWDSFQFIDVRTLRMQGVILGFRITMSNSGTGAVSVNSNSVIRYTVQNLNATALPTPVQF